MYYRPVRLLNSIEISQIDVEKKVSFYLIVYLLFLCMFALGTIIQASTFLKKVICSNKFEKC